LVFRATDRYRLVRVTVTLDSQQEETWEVLLSAADAKQLVTVLPRTGLQIATLGPADDGRFGVAVVDGASFQFTPIDGDYPKTDQIIPATFEPTDSIAFKPGQLTDIKKMPGLGSKKDNPVVFRLNGPHKPALAEWTDGVSEYLYLLMPTKVEG
jgi:DNA polymerase III sliding clamp (beta) subunit (PCNA family)